MEPERHASEDRIGSHRSGFEVPDWAGLTPAGVAALGPPSRPVERLVGVQSAVYRLIVALGELRLPRRQVSERPKAREAAPAQI